MGSRRVVVLAAVLILAACGGGEKTVTVYLSQRLGPDGPPGQIAPVLMPVERTLRSASARPYQIVKLIRRGPAPGEWGKGFVETIDTETRVRSVSVLGSTATVELDGEEPDLYGSAAIVYSLTSLPDIDTVQLRVNGRDCCVHRQSGQPIKALTAKHFDGWQGEPCALRVQTDAVICRHES
jgi:hypothetical protein